MSAATSDNQDKEAKVRQADTKEAELVWEEGG